MFSLRERDNIFLVESFNISGECKCLNNIRVVGYLNNLNDLRIRKLFE